VATLAQGDHIWEKGASRYPHAVGVVVVKLSKNKKRLTRFKRKRVVAASTFFEYKRDVSVECTVSGWGRGKSRGWGGDCGVVVSGIVFCVLWVVMIPLCLIL